MSTPIAPTDREAAARPHAAADGGGPVREVVVGVDGTECALAAVRWAAQEAARRSAPLRIVHAAPYLSRRGPTGTPPPELSRARGITAVAYTAARHAAPSVGASTEVVPDDPTSVLLRAAAAGQLVVVGSSATGAADEMVLAPVALRVAARSPQPVVVVPRRRKGASADRPVVAVLGIGERADDEAVAAFAAAAAADSGAALSVLQTRSSSRTVADSWVDEPQEWTRRFPGLEVALRAAPSARANQILQASGPAPLLVLSAGRGHLLHRTLDGPHRWLLRHCTSPMALVPPVDRLEPQPQQEVLALG
ncbi:MAG: putative universal stress protein [Blastococcus sp.]|jgi:nucleotide-binding universal stress UspA family protein|nr:putative universal stress protein [Blastococcus sp.]